MDHGGPTVVGVPDFNASEDAAALRKAMDGLGTDVKTITDIFTTRSNAQRQAIARAYKDNYSTDLMADLNCELGICLNIDLKRVIKALMLPPVEYLCKELNKFLKIKPDLDTLVEILCPRTKTEIAAIVETYERMYQRPLVEHVCHACRKTSDAFRRLLALVITGVRDEAGEVEPARARKHAQALYDAGEGRFWSTDFDVFNSIFARESFPQLRQIFEEYKSISGRTIEQAIDAKIDDELKVALSTIVECVQNTPAWFATCLHEAIEGLGTDDYTLVRVVVSRSEIDLVAIKTEYERLYNRTLESDIKGDTSRDYKRALVALLGPR